MRFFGLFMVLGFRLLGQIHWADKVVGFSSERTSYRNTMDFRSVQALGRPVRFVPEGEETPLAWCPASSDAPVEEYLKVAFSVPKAGKKLAIVENLNAGSVSMVSIWTDETHEKIIYEATPTKTATNARILQIALNTAEPILAIKVLLKVDKVAGFNQIDGIGISETDEDVKLGINYTKLGKEKVEKELMLGDINSKLDELAPVLSRDGKFMYFTRSESDPSQKLKILSQNIFKAKLGAKGEAINVEKLPADINNKKYNAAIGISLDNLRLYQINYIDAKGKLKEGLSVSLFERGHWLKATEIRIEKLVDNSSSQLREYAISPDEEVILLSMQGQNSIGEKDLYFSKKKGPGVFSEPINLGSVINSDRDEGQPYLANDGKTMFFSSFGHTGFGDGDIFVSRRLDDSWTNWSIPENLGSPINTPSFNGFVSVTPNGDFAYISSKNTASNSEDIYKVRLPLGAKPEPIMIVSGTVIDMKSKKAVDAEIIAEYIDAIDGSQKKIVADYNPTNGEYKIILPPKQNYILTAKKDGYLSVTENLDMSKETRFRDIKKPLTMVPLEKGASLVLNNLFFGQGSDVIQPISVVELTKIAELMKTYPQMEVLLHGHTDNQGDLLENIKLSQKRVDNVRKFVSDLGILPDRIATKAWGGANPIASNATEETRKKNRRVAFEITKM